MPWPWLWCEALYDPTGSWLAGRPQFDIPYPRPLFSERQRWNSFILEAMRVTWRAVQVFSKNAVEWDGEDDEFFKWMVAGVKQQEQLYGRLAL